MLHFQKGWEALGPERKEEYQSRAEQMQLQYDSKVSEYRGNARFDAFAEECSQNDSCSEDGTDSNRDEEVSDVGESLPVCQEVRSQSGHHLLTSCTFLKTRGRCKHLVTKNCRIVGKRWIPR